MARSLIWIVIVCLGLVSGYPALRKIPKIYNAVVTTTQNLAPSRAYPVIQPIVHRTAIGYVPPLYYTSINPNYEPIYTTYGGYGNPFPGPESPPQPGPLRHSPVTDNPEVEQVDIAAQPESSSSDKILPTESVATENKNTKIIIPDSTERDGENEEPLGDNIESTKPNTQWKNKPKKIDEKKEKKDDLPLNFYPNYRSMYLYGYNNPYQQVPSFATPGNYFVDYLPRAPIYSGQMTTGPPPFHDDPLSPGNPGDNHDDRQNFATLISAQQQRDKVPDVPPTYGHKST